MSIGGKPTVMLMILNVCSSD